MPEALCAANVHGCQKEADMNKQKLTILYERLSVDDDRDSGESNSIATQKRILEKYAVDHGFTNYVHMVDDGYSGVNFDRPAFQQMLVEVQAGNVSQCVVKDMSRYGRNYLQVGLYMELFEQHGVRIIAVNDGVDTGQGIDDFTPFRNILNEWFARDCSRKVKSALASKGRDGKPLSSKPPFGYKRDPNDKYAWLVDEDAAAVVRHIYDLCIEGYGPFEIARILHTEKVERPSYFQTKRGNVKYGGALEAEDPYLWCTTQVALVLSRAEYVGATVNFRTVKPSYKSKKQHKNPRTEWLIFENTHEPIVDQKTWELVQQLRQTIKRTDTIGEANPLTGLIYCADCGRRLYNHRKRINHYTCSGYTSGRQKFKETHCSPHYVTTEMIRDVLLDIIKRTSGYAREHEADFVERVREMSSLQQGETVKNHTRQISKNERRIAELDKLFISLYEDKVSGAISAERFAHMSGGYEQEQATLKHQNETLQLEIDAFNADSMKAENFLALVRRYTRIEELSAAMINEFVEKIVIHESVWSEQDENNRRKGSRTQKIEVFLKYVGCINVPDTRSAEEIEAERIEMEKRERKRAQKRESGRREREKKRAAKIAANMPEQESKTTRAKPKSAA